MDGGHYPLERSSTAARPAYSFMGRVARRVISPVAIINRAMSIEAEIVGDRDDERASR